MVDRKQSPLVPEDDAPPWEDTPPPHTPPSTGSDQQKQQDVESAPPPAPEPRTHAERFPMTSRRKRSEKALDPFDKVSFNANIPLVLRRLARMLAARWECDVQDVIATGLLDLFEREGIEVPTTRAEYDRLVKAGKL